MKKIAFLLILCMLFCTPGNPAHAETSYTFEKLDFPEDAPFDIAFVDEVFPISDEEIWMSFYGPNFAKDKYLCIAKGDMNVNIQEYRYIPIDWAYRLLAMKKVDDNYLIGTQSGTEDEYRISYLPQKGIPEKYYELDKKFVRTVYMYAGSKGIYACGVSREEEYNIYKLLLIDENLELVFERELYKTPKYLFPRRLGYPYLVEQDNKLYLYLEKENKENISECFLYCLTLDGEILWKKPFENKIFVRGMAANQDGLYFYGEKGRSHAKVVSYNLEGEEKWDQDVLEEEGFTKGTVNGKSLFVLSYNENGKPQMLSQIEADGKRKNLISIDKIGFYIDYLGVDDKGIPFMFVETITVKENFEKEDKLHLWRVVEE